MTERFNFHDLYGDVIPGLTLGGLLWVPFGLDARAWPDFEWSRRPSRMPFRATCEATTARFDSHAASEPLSGDVKRQGS